MLRIITFGTYDLFHKGHYNILFRAKHYKNQTNYLIVGVSSDELNKTKGKVSYEDINVRLQKIKNTNLVDEFFIEESLSLKQKYIDDHKADVLIMGDDWKGHFDWVNIPCVYLPRTQKVSSSWLKIQQRTSTKKYTFLFYDAHSKKHLEYYDILKKYFDILGIHYFLYDETQQYNVSDFDAVILFNKKSGVVDEKFHEQISKNPFILIDHGASNCKWFLADLDRYNSIDYFLVCGPKHKKSMDAFFGDNGKVISTGFIKSEKLFEKPPDFDVNDFFEKYKIDKNKKIILFAPTYNKYTDSMLFDYNDMTEIYKQLDGIDNVIYSLHPEDDDIKLVNKVVINDICTSELIKISDVIISDFSSILYESAVLGKKNIQILMSSYPDNPAKHYTYPLMAGLSDVFVGGIPTLPIFLKETINNIDNYSQKIFDTIYYNLSCTSSINNEAHEKIITHLLNIADHKQKKDVKVTKILPIKKITNVIVNPVSIKDSISKGYTLFELSEPNKKIKKYQDVNFILDIKYFDIVKENNVIFNITCISEFKKLETVNTKCIFDISKNNEIGEDQINTLKYITANNVVGIKMTENQTNNDIIYALQSFGKPIFIINYNKKIHNTNRSFIVNNTCKKIINEPIEYHIHDVYLEYMMLSYKEYNKVINIPKFIVCTENIKWSVLNMVSVNNSFYAICDYPILVKLRNDEFIRIVPILNKDDVNEKMIWNGSLRQDVNSILIEDSIKLYDIVSKNYDTRNIMFKYNKYTLPSYMFFNKLKNFTQLENLSRIENEYDEYVFLYKYILIISDNMTEWKTSIKLPVNNKSLVDYTTYIPPYTLLLSNYVTIFKKNNMEKEWNDICKKIEKLTLKSVNVDSILSFIDKRYINEVLNIIETSFFGMTSSDCRYGLNENIQVYSLKSQFMYLYDYRQSFTNGIHIINEIKEHSYVIVNINGCDILLRQLIYPVTYDKYDITCVECSYCVSLDGKIVNKPIKYIPLLNTNIEQQKELFKLVVSFIKSHHIHKMIKFNNNKYYIPESYVIDNEYVIISEAVFVYKKTDQKTFEISDKKIKPEDVIEFNKNLSYMPINNMYIQKNTEHIIKEEFPLTYSSYTNKPIILVPYPSYEFKINCNLILDDREINFNHRAGWKYVLNLLKSNIIYNTMARPIKIIDLIEKTFSWDYIDLDSQLNKQKIIIFAGKTYHVYIGDLKIKYTNGKSTHVVKINDNYLTWSNNEWVLDRTETDDLFRTRKTLIDDMVITDEWIGFWHNPQNMPKWFDYQHSPQSILKRKSFQKSLEKCKGIFVLSNYFKTWLKQNISSSIPISVLYHPTEDVKLKFDYNLFLENKEKCVIQIGYWLRNLCSIGLITHPDYKKIWLYGNDWAYDCLKREQEEHKKNNIPCANLSNILQIRLSDEWYDVFLSKNIAFVNVYDSSANNAVIECIVRYTPLIINRHPAIVEYLGDDYPLYFNDMKQVDDMLSNYDLIKKTHEYLKNNKKIKDQISSKTFLQQFVTSEVIINL